MDEYNVVDSYEGKMKNIQKIKLRRNSRFNPMADYMWLRVPSYQGDSFLEDLVGDMMSWENQNRAVQPFMHTVQYNNVCC